MLVLPSKRDQTEVGNSKNLVGPHILVTLPPKLENEITCEMLWNIENRIIEIKRSAEGGIGWYIMIGTCAGAHSVLWGLEPRFWQCGGSNLGGDTRWSQCADLLFFQGLRVGEELKSKQFDNLEKIVMFHSLKIREFQQVPPLPPLTCTNHL